MSWEEAFIRSLEEGGVKISPGMANHYRRMTGERVFHTCSDCDLPIGVYPGRNCRYCPNCGTDMSSQENYPGGSPISEDGVTVKYSIHSDHQKAARELLKNHPGQWDRDGNYTVHSSNARKVSHTLTSYGVPHKKSYTGGMSESRHWILSSGEKMDLKGDTLHRDAVRYDPIKFGIGKDSDKPTPPGQARHGRDHAAQAIDNGHIRVDHDDNIGSLSIQAHPTPKNISLAQKHFGDKFFTHVYWDDGHRGNTLTKEKFLKATSEDHVFPKYQSTVSQFHEGSLSTRVRVWRLVESLCPEKVRLERIEDGVAMFSQSEGGRIINTFSIPLSEVSTQSIQDSISQPNTSSDITPTAPLTGDIPTENTEECACDEMLGSSGGPDSGTQSPPPNNTTPFSSAYRTPSTAGGAVEEEDDEVQEAVQSKVLPDHASANAHAKDLLDKGMKNVKLTKASGGYLVTWWTKEECKESWEKEFHEYVGESNGQGHKHTCAWCKTQFGKADIPGSHGICLDCFKVVKAEIERKSPPTKTVKESKADDHESHFIGVSGNLHSGIPGIEHHDDLVQKRSVWGDLGGKSNVPPKPDDATDAVIDAPHHPHVIRITHFHDEGETSVAGHFSQRNVDLVKKHQASGGLPPAKKVHWTDTAKYEPTTGVYPVHTFSGKKFTDHSFGRMQHAAGGSRVAQFHEWTKTPDSSTKSEPGYLYHATNRENAHDIASSGHLVPHKPSHGTDQRSWPDGGTEKRSYFTPNANTAWQFAPEEGHPVLLRTKHEPHFRKEVGDDHYTREKIPHHKLEILGHDDKWHPMSKLNEVETVKVENPALDGVPPVPKDKSREDEGSGWAGPIEGWSKEFAGELGIEEWESDDFGVTVPQKRYESRATPDKYWVLDTGHVHKLDPNGAHEHVAEIRHPDIKDHFSSGKDSDEKMMNAINSGRATRTGHSGGVAYIHGKEGSKSWNHAKKHLHDTHGHETDLVLLEDPPRHPLSLRGERDRTVRASEFFGTKRRGTSLAAQFHEGEGNGDIHGTPDPKVARKSVVGIVIKGEEVLLGRSLSKDDRAGMWCFPGGGIDPEDGGDPSAAVKREVFEESGVEVLPTGESVTHPLHNGVVFMVCQYVSGTPRQSPEFSDWMWTPMGTIDDLQGVYPANRQLIHLVGGRDQNGSK